MCEKADKTVVRWVWKPCGVMSRDQDLEKVYIPDDPICLDDAVGHLKTFVVRPRELSYLVSVDAELPEPDVTIEKVEEGV